MALPLPPAASHLAGTQLPVLAQHHKDPSGTQVQIRTRTEFEETPEETFGEVQCISLVDRNSNVSKEYEVPSNPSEFFKRGKVCDSVSCRLEIKVTCRTDIGS
jgi:hypothetical protein